MEMRAVRWSMGGLILLGLVACDTESTGPSELDVPAAASKLESGADDGVTLFEDRIQHARFYPAEGEFGVIRQCQANPVEDADGNDWRRTRNKDGSSFSKLVEPRGVVLVREVALSATDFDAGGNLRVPGYSDDRWVVTAGGIGHITVGLWRDAFGRPQALHSNVHADVAPLADSDWLGILDEPGDEVGGAHDLRNEVFTWGSPALARFEGAVAEAKATRSLGRLDCDTHIWYAEGQPSWIQRNAVVLRW